MRCVYQTWRNDWSRLIENYSDAELQLRLAVIKPSWDCGPHMWTLWRMLLRSEAIKRGLGT